MNKPNTTRKRPFFTKIKLLNYLSPSSYFCLATFLTVLLVVVSFFKTAKLIVKRHYLPKRKLS